MPANFSNLRLSYDLEDIATLNFSLKSMQFDINQVNIGPDTPFTTEMSFELGLERSHSISSFNSLNTSLRDYQLLDGVDLEGDRVVDQLTDLFRTHVFSNDNLLIQYFDIGAAIARLFDSTNLQVLITSIQDDGQKLFDWAWNVKLKFRSVWEGNNDPTPYGTAAVLFPQLGVSGQVGNVEGLTPFNDELRLNYEILYQPMLIDASGVSLNSASEIASSIGKASDELTDSLSGLTNTLHSNLSGTFSTRLQPVGSTGTNDLALWMLILKGTEALSFSNFDQYMNAIFCSTNHDAAASAQSRVASLAQARSLPFMNVDAYRCVKIAAEAFVMVNCMVDGVFTDEDVEELKARVPLRDGNFDKTQLDQWWNDYQVKLNFHTIVESDGELSVLQQQINTIPYLAVIRSKLKDQDLKMTPFDAAFSQYLDSDLDQTANTCFGLISERLSHPCYLELIWSYWHEESMMVQGLNAISRRFQNVRAPGRDPLASLELDPLRPLNNLLWGYVQDEQHRLSVRRRAYEYDHHYGIRMEGTITKKMRFADSRSKFIEAFHRLLNLVSRFYNQADDMTVNPDSYPVLNGLKEVHMILSEGAHNQYGDLPSTARAEMLTQQWLLARPEFRQFLSGRTMVAYPEQWMEPVATANTLMGWTQSSPLHFRDLGRFGEQLLLSIRFGNWSNITDRRFAANWSHFWREQIQGYIHSYRAVTGVDLSLDTVKVDTRQPSYHLLKQLQTQRKGKNRVA